MKDCGAKDLSSFFTAVLGIQRHLLKTLRAKGPEEAAGCANYLMGLCDRVDQASTFTSTTQLLLPSLTDEDNPEAYLHLFERAALSSHLPKPQWPSVLASLLTGEAKLACGGVSGETDRLLTFQDLKGMLLGGGWIAEQNCRERFRSQKHCIPGMSPRAVALELQQEAIGWLKPHSRSGWEVMQCVVMEQFTRLLPELTAHWVWARRPSNLEEVVKLVEAHLSLSADTYEEKVSCDTADIVTEMAYAVPKRNHPSLPQWFPSDIVNLATLNRLPKVQVEELKGSAEVHTEGSNSQWKGELHIQAPLVVDKHLDTISEIPYHRHSPSSSSPVAEEPQHEQSFHTAESETMDTGDECQLSLSDSSCSTMAEQQRQHRPHLDPEGEEGYVSSQREKTFPFFEQRHQHQDTHSNQPRFLCPDCGHSCCTSTALKKHRTTHFPTRLFPCPDCGESFTYAKYLVHHRTVHAALRPYRCPVCLKTFRLKNGLKRHERSHREGHNRSSVRPQPATLKNRPPGLAQSVLSNKRSRSHSH